MPVVAAEGATGQSHLHDVVELPVASKDFHLAIVKQVISAADPRGNFVGESEVNGWEACWIVGRLVFFIETDAEIQSEPLAYGPGILDVKSVRRLLICAGIIHAVSHDIVTKLALAAGFVRIRGSAEGRVRLILRYDWLAGRGTGHW